MLNYQEAMATPSLENKMGSGMKSVHRAPFVNSPGGIANVNFYTSQYESSDIFGGSNPRYIYGEYGNLYGRGQSYGTIEHGAMPTVMNTGAPNPFNISGSPIPYWMTDEHRSSALISGGENIAGLSMTNNPVLNQSLVSSEMVPSPDDYARQRKMAEKVEREPFTWVGDEKRENFELTTEHGGLTLKLNHPLLDILVLILAYISLMFLQRCAVDYFSTTFAEGEPDWRMFLLWSLGFAVVALLIVYAGRTFLKKK